MADKYAIVALLPGILLLVLGAISLGVGYSLPAGLEQPFTVFAIVCIILGLVFMYVGWRRYNSIAYRRRLSRRARRTLATLIILFLSIAIPATAAAQEENQYIRQITMQCYQQYLVTYSLELATLGISLAFALLFFLPLFAANIPVVGMVLGVLRDLTGAGLLVALIALLLIWGAHNAYTAENSNQPPSPNDCTINLDNLERNGPIILRLILKVIKASLPQIPTVTSPSW